MDTSMAFDCSLPQLWASELSTESSRAAAKLFDYISSLVMRSDSASSINFSGSSSSQVVDSSAMHVEAIVLSMESSTKLISPTPYALPVAGEPTALDKIMHLVRRLGDYESDWDGYGAEPPSAGAQNDAELFAVYNLGALEISLPKVSAASDGEVNFFWKSIEGIFDVGFYGDGTYSYYAKLASGKEFFSDGSPLKERPPTEVLRVISGA